MLFNTPLFIVFFFLFYVCFHLVFKKNEHKLWVITIGSLIFYGSFDYRFIFILLITGVADFFIAQAIAATSDAQRKRRLLILSVVLNLSMLAVFKYTGFVLTNVFTLLHLFGVNLSPPVLHIILPLGISFYVFQSISYIVDVYRGSFEPRRQIHEFIASLMFFPHLVAGPIVRSSSLLPQFERITAPDWDTVKRGFLIISLGLLKKTIADLIAPIVMTAFSGSGPHSLLESWTGGLGFAAQVYGDFAGYTDMAIGIALLLGFHLPPNFDLPFIASSPADFWTRWHISLSTWLRDYLFMPLAVRFRSRLYLCLMITWILAGVWHGPDWNFVAYGVYHGSLLVAWHFIARRIPYTWTENPSVLWTRYGTRILTFYLIVVGFVVFRAPTWQSCFAVLRGMHFPSVPSATSYEAVINLVLIVVALFFTHFVDYLAIHKWDRVKRPLVLWLICAGSLSFSFCFGRRAISFIYFQF